MDCPRLVDARLPDGKQQGQVHRNLLVYIQFGWRCGSGCVSGTELRFERECVLSTLRRLVAVILI